MEYLILDGQTFLLGFVWTKETQKRFVSHAKLKEMAQAIDPEFDLAAVHKVRKATQYGFGKMGKRENEMKKGVALAPLLRNLEFVSPMILGRRSRMFLGMFRLVSGDGRGFWWIHFQMDGQILRHGDRVFYDYDEAYSELILLQELAGLNDQMTLICDTPASSRAFFKKSLRYSLIDRFILSTAHIIPLKKLFSRTFLYRAVIGFVTTAVLVGIFATLSIMEENERRLVITAAQENRLKERQTIEQHPDQFFDKNWQTELTGEQFARMCVPAMMQVPLSSNGWDLKSVKCDGKTLVVTWGFVDGADFINLPVGAKRTYKLQQGKNVTVRSIFPLPHPSGFQPGQKDIDFSDLHTRASAMGIMSEFVVSSGAKLSGFQFNDQEKKKVKEIPITAPWHVASWKLDQISDLLIDDASDPHGAGLFSMLGAVPGFTIQSLSYDVSKDQGWTIVGTSYAKHSDKIE